MSLITTSVLPATATQVPRIKALSPLYGMSIIVPWDFSISDHIGQHAEAALALCRKMNLGNAYHGGELDAVTLVGDLGALSRNHVAYAWNATCCVNLVLTWDV